MFRKKTSATVEEGIKELIMTERYAKQSEHSLFALKPKALKSTEQCRRHCGGRRLLCSATNLVLNFNTEAAHTSFCKRQTLILSVNLVYTTK